MVQKVNLDEILSEVITMRGMASELLEQSDEIIEKIEQYKQNEIEKTEQETVVEDLANGLLCDEEACKKCGKHQAECDESCPTDEIEVTDEEMELIKSMLPLAKLVGKDLSLEEGVEQFKAMKAELLKESESEDLSGCNFSELINNLEEIDEDTKGSEKFENQEEPYNPFDIFGNLGGQGKQDKQVNPQDLFGNLGGLGDVFGNLGKMPNFGEQPKSHTKQEPTLGDLLGNPLVQMAVEELLKGKNK